jgi:CRP/FNR family cyclic AMP-dependent transcriptional regulator
VSHTTASPTETSNFLAALDDESAGALRSLTTTRQFRRGATLLYQGVNSDRVLVLLSGRVKVSYLTEDGKEAIFAFFAHGELLGELAAIDGGPYSATVTALDPVEALVMPATEFRRLLRAHPGVAMAVLATVTRRLRYADRQRVDFAAFDTLGRVARGLIELADRFGEPAEHGVRITLPLSQEELASWTGASREAVSKALKLLRKLGWITTDRRCITVLDSDALRGRAL